MLANNLTLTALRAVAAIAESGSVTGAAETLNLSQPALSYQIRQVETRVGARIFDRTRDGMIPTAAGERLARAARAVDAELERAERDVERLLAGEEGVLRISSECFTAYHWLAGVLCAFRRKYPKVQVEIDVTTSRRPLEALRHGDLDIVLTTVPPDDSTLRVTPLFDDEIVAVMPSDHPLASRPWLAAPDFADQAVLVFSEEASDLFNLVLRPAGVRPRYVADVRVTEAIVEMVKAGLGISVLASWVVQPELEAGDLVGVRVTGDGIHRSWTGITCPRAGAPDYVPYFLAALVETLEAPDPTASRRGPRLARDRPSARP